MIVAALLSRTMILRIDSVSLANGHCVLHFLVTPVLHCLPPSPFLAKMLKCHVFPFSLHVLLIDVQVLASLFVFFPALWTVPTHKYCIEASHADAMEVINITLDVLSSNHV